MMLLIWQILPYKPKKTDVSLPYKPKKIDVSL